MSARLLDENVTSAHNSLLIPNEMKLVKLQAAHNHLNQLDDVHMIMQAYSGY